MNDHPKIFFYILFSTLLSQIPTNRRYNEYSKFLNGFLSSNPQNIFLHFIFYTFITNTNKQMIQRIKWFFKWILLFKSPKIREQIVLWIQTQGRRMLSLDCSTKTINVL